MKKIFLPLIISLIFALLLTGCSKPENYGECYNTEKMSNFEKINKISNISFQLENSLLENLKSRDDMINTIKANDNGDRSSPVALLGDNTFVLEDEDQYSIVNYSRYLVMIGPTNIDFNLETTDVSMCDDKLSEVVFFGNFHLGEDVKKVVYKDNTKIIVPISHKDTETFNNMKGYLSIIQNDEHTYYMIALYLPDYYDEAKALYTAKSFEFKNTKQPSDNGKDVFNLEITYDDDVNEEHQHNHE